MKEDKERHLIQIFSCFCSNAKQQLHDNFSHHSECLEKAGEGETLESQFCFPLKNPSKVLKHKPTQSKEQNPKPFHLHPADIFILSLMLFQRPVTCIPHIWQWVTPKGTARASPSAFYVRATKICPARLCLEQLSLSPL